MANTIEVNGKTFLGVEPVSLAVLEQASALAAKMTELRQQAEKQPDKTELWEEIDRLWLLYCGLQLEGDVAELSRWRITLDDQWELENFFGSRAASTMKKFAAARKSSPATISPDQGANLTRDTKSNT